MLKFCSLYSGSSGNCLYVSSGKTKILVDCGTSCKKICEGLASIDSSIEDIDAILTTGGTGLDPRDITVETVESLFEKRLEGFGEIFRAKSYEEIGAAALLSRATAGIYKKTVIFSMPGSPNAVKTAFSIIIDELPHFVHHVKK